MSDTNVHRVVGNLLVGTSHFFVDTTNNKVGINTSSPSASLDVATGDVKVGSGITLASSTGTITATGGFSGNGSGLTGVNSDSGSWVNGSSSNIHLAVSTDNVGIGVLDASYKLDVDGDINISSGSTLRVDGTPAVFSNWSVHTNGSDIYRSSGNVGIGATSPGVKLDVDGDVRLSGLLTVGNYASAPSTALNGSMYYDTTVKTLKLYADNTWGSISGGSGGGTNYYLDRVYSSTYSTTANWTNLSADTVKFQDEINISDTNLSSWYDTSNGRFTPLMTGWYIVNWSVSFDLNGGTGGSGECFSSLHKNNSYYSWGSNHKSYNQTGNQADIVSHGSCLVYLNGSTDYLHIEFFSHIGTSGIINPGPSPMRFQVQKVSWYENGSQYSMSGNSIIFEANSRSPNQVISANTDTAIFVGTGQVIVNTDTGPFFDISTGRYTPQVSGWYLVTWSVVTNVASGPFTTVLKKNQTEWIAGSKFENTSAHYNCSTGSTMIALNGTGDYIVLHFKTAGSDVRVFPSSSFPSRFTIFRMSDL